MNTEACGINSHGLIWGIVQVQFGGKRN